MNFPFRRSAISSSSRSPCSDTVESPSPEEFQPHGKPHSSMIAAPNAPTCARGLAVLGLLLIGSGCRINHGTMLSTVAAEINDSLAPLETVVVPGDRLSIQFPAAIDWNQEVVVQADGSAGLLGIDQFRVAGQTLTQLDQSLTRAYGEVFDAPELSVTLMATAERSITVLGEVQTPGKIVLTPGQRLTLIEALGQAGGFENRSAHLGNVVLLRWDTETQGQLAWHVDMRPRHWTGDTPVLLQPHDVVYVPNVFIDDIGIWIDNHIRRMIPLPILPFN